MTKASRASINLVQANMKLTTIAIRFIVVISVGEIVNVFSKGKVNDSIEHLRLDFEVLMCTILILSIILMM